MRHNTRICEILANCLDRNAFRICQIISVVWSQKFFDLKNIHTTMYRTPLYTIAAYYFGATNCLWKPWLSSLVVLNLKIGLTRLGRGRVTPFWVSRVLFSWSICDQPLIEFIKWNHVQNDSCTKRRRISFLLHSALLSSYVTSNF